MKYTHEQVARGCYALYRQLAQEQGMRRPGVWALQHETERCWWERWAEQASWGWSSQQMHEDWCAELVAAGWRPGPETDYEGKAHPGLVPWDVLGLEHRFRLDVVQMTAVVMALCQHPFWADEGRVTAL